MPAAAARTGGEGGFFIRETSRENCRNPVQPRGAWMSFIGKIHDGIVLNRRVEALARHIAELLPPNAGVLDIGCGDGMIDSLIMKLRGDVFISGIDVFVRDNVNICVTAFDGNLIPYETGSFDAVMLIDVLHHTQNPANLLKEAGRVSRDVIVLKDHIKEGVLAGATLRFMDWIGNAHHGVVLSYNYSTQRQWVETFAALNLTIQKYETRLGLYPWPMNLLFERSLHFIAKLSRRPL
jgi:SAM-dependent methyltransferase